MKRDRWLKETSVVAAAVAVRTAAAAAVVAADPADTKSVVKGATAVLRLSCSPPFGRSSGASEQRLLYRPYFFLGFFFSFFGLSPRAMTSVCHQLVLESSLRSDLF